MSVLEKYSDLPDDVDALSKTVVDCLFHVHKELGAGYLEQTYEEALSHEFDLRGIRYVRQKKFEIIYKGKALPTCFKSDLIVNDQILLELKAVDYIHPLHKAQIYAYLKGTNLPLGLLVNFNVPLIKDGIERYKNKNFVPSESRS